MLRTPSVRLRDQNYLVPENTDLKSKPFVDSLNQFSLSLQDLLLASALNSFQKVQITRKQENATLITDNSLQKELLETIQLYPAQYSGQITPETTAACQLIAGQLNDTYDVDKRHFTRQKFLDNDYLGIIAYEAALGKNLVAFGPTWILPSTAKYVSEQLNYGSVRTAALREKLLNINSKAELLPDQFVDVSEGQIVTEPKDPVFKLDQVNVYTFHDRHFLNEHGNLTPLYMMFAPINADEMERILLYLNRNIKLYSFYHTLAIEDLPLSRGLDFRYLFPVELSYVGNYTVISSKEISEERLMQIYHLQEIPFAMPRIDDIRGTYATYLLAEALFYEFELYWNKRSLNVGLAGWIQAHDIYEQFGLILNDVNRENMHFVKLESYLEAVQYADQTNAKCFYYLGNYYAALNEDVTPDLTAQPQIAPVHDPGLLETLNPLRAVVQLAHKRAAKKYLQSLGYDITPNPEEYYIDLKLGHRTYEANNKQVTIYYYKSTHDQEIIIHQADGFSNLKSKNALEKLLQQGYFFDQKTINITRGYPEFIPSYAPLYKPLN